MSKYIDAEKLKAEVKKRKKFHEDAMNACVNLPYTSLTHSAGWKEDKELLDLIDSLQQEMWKPTEEQMKALDYAQGEICNPDVHDPKYNGALCSLIDDLKKL